MKRAIFYTIIGYLSGSVLFARVAERLFHRKGAIEESPDQNPGAFNAFRYGGFWCGLLTLCGDLLITKPGGLSSTEAAVAGIPLIQTAPIPGCEVSNMRFFRQRGLSIAVPYPGRQLIAACDALLSGGGNDSPSETPINPHAAANICSLAGRLSGAARAAG